MEANGPLRILFVEDLPSDAELAEMEIRKSELEFTSQRVDTKDAFLKALEEFHPDVIVSDYSMPTFDGMQALKLSLERDARVPFILLTGSMNEETAVACMKAGASDYVIKEHITRLPFAVKEALERKKMRVARDEAERALREGDKKFRAVWEKSTDGMRITNEEGVVVLVNDAYCKLVEKPHDEIEGKPMSIVYEEARQAEILRKHQERFRSRNIPVYLEREITLWNGNRLYLELSNTFLEIANQPTLSLSVLRDDTARKLAELASKRAEEERARNEDRLQCLYDISRYRAKDTQNLLDYALEHAIRLTGSKIGYIYHYDEENRQFVLNTWSKEVMKECSVVDPPTVYQLDKTGIWGEAVRQRKPIVVNEFQAPNELKKGCPQGHVELHKYLTIPVFDEKRIVAVVGVANKESDYDESDVRQLTLLMDAAWKITVRKRAEEALHESEERYRNVVNVSPDAIAIHCEGKIVFVNPAAVQLLGVTSPNDLIGKPAIEFVHPDDREFARSRIAEIFNSGKPAPLAEERFVKMDGSVIYVEVAAALTTYEGKQASLVVLRDMTDRKSVQKRLEEERNLLRTIINAIPDEITVKDLERRFVLVNPGTVKALKRSSEEEIIGKRDEDLIPETFALQAKEEEESVFATGCPSLNKVGKSRINPATGEIERSILISKLPLKDSSAKVIGLVGINRDITEVQRAAASLEKERTLLLTLIESIPDEICLKDPAHRFIVANSAVVRALGARSMEELLGKTDLDFVSPELAQMHFDEEDAILESGHPLINRERTRRSPLTGEIEKCLLTTKVPVRDKAGKKIGVLVVNRYITERKKADEALRSSEEKYRALFEESKDAVYISSADGRLRDINLAGVQLFGYDSKEELLQIDLSRDGYVDPKQRERFRTEMEKAGYVKDFELTLKRRGGDTLTVLETATAVRDKLGNVVMHRGIIRDVTSQRQLERQFLQAQKMESIGTLAGGIAHDFNNILGIVLGHLALLERTRENEAQFEESIFSINKAVERGASLVRQILTFARKAETQLEPVNINSMIKELVKMLEETFPKTLSVVQTLDKTIPVISMDPTQLHQTLLNLCVNARDAMEGAGTLVIATHLVLGRDVSSRFPKASANHYVQVSVADSGSGMDEETKRRIFEPFFTTKGEGKGTGLGLAVVYGVLHTHNGFVDVESAPGHGTTFHLFFPVPEGILTTSEMQRGPQEYLPRGTETILLVEDEDVLRDLLAKLLEMQGYTVFTASDGDEAVKRFGEHADEIDLVLSDMGLPKRSGWDAFRMMQKINSNVRVLLASGYLDPAQKSEILDSGVKRFLGKPYRMDEVLKSVRETLDEKE